MSVVLVTGVSGHVGSQLAARLAADPTVDRVLGVDTAAPVGAAAAVLGGVDFVRADIRNPLISGVLATAAVDTVVHLSVTPVAGRSRTAMKERNVIGTMQLLAACQRTEHLRRLVVKSTTAVYGAASTAPAVHAETAESAPGAVSGFARDAVEIEGYVRGFSRRRPDVAVSVLRCATVIGPTTGSALAGYLALPIVPTGLGFDPRVQLLHESDVLAVLESVVRSGRPGTVNVAGDGVLLLSQLVRRSHRISVAVPGFVADSVGRLLPGGGAGAPHGRAQFLTSGVVADTTRLRTEYGYVPQYSTAAAFDDFLAHQNSRSILERVASSRAGGTAIHHLARLVSGSDPNA